MFPVLPWTGTVTGRAILTRAVIHVQDVASDPEHTYSGLLEPGFRAVLSVPMLRDGAPIGAITVTRRVAFSVAGARNDRNRQAVRDT